MMGTDDPASYLTEANSIVVDNDGQGDRVVNASDGAILAGFTADVEFDVVDDANAVAAEVAGSGFGPGGLDEAGDVVVSGGDVDTAEAADIQQVSEYNEHQAALTRFPDNVASVIGAGSSVIENGGVTRIEVEGDANSF